MNSIRCKVNGRFSSLEGGLFSEVSKADVGEAVGRLIEQGVDILAWADPFYPDPSIPESVKLRMSEALASGLPSHYTMPIGAPELRRAVARMVERKHGISLDPSRNIIITPGSDSGLLYAMMPFLSPGDEVIVPSPSYPNNFLNPELLGAKVCPLKLLPEEGYQIPIERLRECITEKSRMLVLCHPNNPTTTVFRRENLQALAELLIEKDLILVCDQAFEDHIYDDIDFLAPAAIEGMWERTLTLASFSKGYGLSGFRIAYIYACDQIMDILYGGAVNVLGAPSHLSSIGAIAAAEDPSCLSEIYTKLERRRRRAYEILSELPNVEMMLPESGILAWLDVSRLGSSSELVSYLIKEASVLVNDGAAYGPGGEGHLRFVPGCFADDDKAEAVFLRIARALSRHPGQRSL